MTLLGLSFDEVQKFHSEVEKIKEKIKTDKYYKSDLKNQGESYYLLKKYFSFFAKFLQYSSKLEKSTALYRVRKNNLDNPFSKKSDLIYPPPALSNENRMSNKSFCVLYTSFHEFTAISEAGLKDDYIGNFFQLTKFLTTKELTVYSLGVFSEIYLNTPRDSKHTKEAVSDLLGKEFIDSDKPIQGYSALECAIANILYDTSEASHLLSSAMADAIFTQNENIDAIIYPSVQNRFGINFAIRQQAADELKVTSTYFNKLTQIYENGFFKYETIMCSTDTSDPEKYKFENLSAKSSFFSRQLR